jgi:hypothetical protein
VWVRVAASLLGGLVLQRVDCLGDGVVGELSGDGQLARAGVEVLVVQGGGFAAA